MQGRDLHRWDLEPDEARSVQRELAGRVRLTGLDHRPKLIAGVDVAYDDPRSQAVAAAVVLDAETLEVVEQAVAVVPCSFEYIPGLLSFREAPAVIAALERLSVDPDVIVGDGHGIAHPARFGLASHLGLLLDRPTIGCAKNWLSGEAAGELGPDRGDRVALIDSGETVGWILRTRAGVKPVFVSPGHLVGIDECCDLVLACAPKYRLPETTRLADQMVRRELGRLVE